MATDGVARFVKAGEGMHFQGSAKCNVMFLLVVGGLSQPRQEQVGSNGLGHCRLLLKLIQNSQLSNMFDLS